jgi:hypothetical protein
MNAALDSDYTAPQRLSGDDTRLSMSRVILGWAFGAIFFQLSAGAVYASFARQLGATEAQFGFLAGIYPLMGFLQIPAARLLELGVSARVMMLTAGLTCRLLWVLAAMLPLLNHVFPEIVRREWLLPAFIGCVLLSSIGQAFTGPSFFTWMSALVPDRVNPFFWARRQQVGTFVSIFAVLVGGGIADHAGWIKEQTNGEFPPLMTYSVLLTLAACCGVMDIAAFIGVKEPPRETKREKSPPFFASIRQPLREPRVRKYLAFSIFGMMGFASTGPLLWLFCLEFLDFDKTQTGLLLTICPLAGMVLTSKWWGGIAKIHGTRPMIRFASMGMVLVPLCWLLALPTSKIGIALMLFSSGILMAAYEISNLNFITRTCPHLPRPTLTALFAICTGTTFALTAWGAGLAAEKLASWHFDVFGIHFVSYHLVFAFSLLPRLVNALILAPRLEDEEASGTRETVNEVGANLAAAFGPRFTRFFEAREE